jgi:hypothetical protein
MAEGLFARRVSLTGAAVFSSLAVPSIVVIPDLSVKIPEISPENPWLSKFNEHQA